MLQRRGVPGTVELDGPKGCTGSMRMRDGALAAVLMMEAMLRTAERKDGE